MATFIAIVALGLAIYAIFEIEKLKKEDPDKIKKELDSTNRIIEQLSNLKEHDCEIIVKDTMFFIDIPYSVEGQIVDFDDDWLLLLSNNKKQINRVIRIAMIKDVMEITK